MTRRKKETKRKKECQKREKKDETKKTEDEKDESSDPFEEEEPIFRSETRSETRSGTRQSPPPQRHPMPSAESQRYRLLTRRILTYGYVVRSMPILAPELPPSATNLPLETKFPVGTDPRIDKYLYGDATAAEWTNFLAYLCKEYGKTKQQKALK